LHRGKLARIAGWFPIAAWIAVGPAAHAQLASDAPLSDARTINSILKQHPGDDLHLVLIHGIRTADRNTWRQFRSLMCGHLNHQCLGSVPVVSVGERLLLAPHPPRTADYFGQTVWANDKDSSVNPQRTADEKWMGSQPFVDHYVFALTRGRRLFVDEINWWPLAYAFKCQFIVRGDVPLVGPDQTNISYCAAADATHFPWFTAAEAGQLLAVRPKSGGAPHINASLKTQIFDWGLSDAVIALGTPKTFLREAVRCAFSDIAAFDPAQVAPLGGISDTTPLAVHDCEADDRGPKHPLPPHAQFVLIAHSLGAFLLMDTFAAAAGDANYYPALGGADSCRVHLPLQTTARASDEPAEGAALRNRSSQSLCDVLQASENVYFFANQFALLELGRTQGLSDFSTTSTETTHPSALTLWADTRSPGNDEKQVVAFSDPGDILTFEVPRIDDAKVFNVYPHNEFTWFGLFEWPPTTHTDYFTSAPVLSAVFGQ
jgi:hypothetical protein